MVLFSLASASCATGVFKEDYSLIRSWSSELQSKEMTLPYFSIFRSGGKELVFVAAKHSKNIESPTHELIANILKKYKPQLLIVEGYPTNLGISPSNLIERANNCPKENCPEQRYAVKIGHSLGTSFLGGMPRGHWLKDVAIKALGVSEIDILGFYIARTLFRGRKTEKKYNHLLKKYGNKLRIKGYKNFDYLQFKNWFSSIMSKKWSKKNLNPNDFAPLDKPIHLFHKISRTLSHNRNIHLAKLIRKHTKKFDKVVVIYGAAHLVSLKPFLEKTISKSEDSNDWNVLIRK